MADESVHKHAIQREFSRQASGILASPVFGSEQTLDRIAAALDLDGSQRVLDVACGPGLVVRRLASDAREVVGVDLTEEMLTRAQELCTEAGLANASFRSGEAEALPFDDGTFDRAVSRLAVHHFTDPGAVLDQMLRVTLPGGLVALVDVCASEDPDEARLHNALERLRDPSHVRMLPPSELRALLSARDVELTHEEGWTQRRDFDEWIAITRDEQRREPLREVMRALASSGRHAGVALQAQGRTVEFDHHWLLLVGKTP